MDNVFVPGSDGFVIVGADWVSWMAYGDMAEHYVLWISPAQRARVLARLPAELEARRELHHQAERLRRVMGPYDGDQAT